jgi:hypothetical protein
MDIVVVVLLVVIVGMLAAALVALGRDRAAGNERSTLPVPVSAGVAPMRPGGGDESLVDVVRSPDGGLQVLEKRSGRVLLDVQPVPSAPARPDPRPSTVPANAALLAGLSGIGVDIAAALSAGTEYVVRFTPEVQRMLDRGSAVLMKTERGLKSVAVSSTSGQILEHGVLVSKSAQSPVQLMTPREVV